MSPEYILTVQSMSSDRHSVLGHDHDIVTWDPRGTGTTLAISCFSESAQTAYNLLELHLPNASNTATGALWAYRKVQADACAEKGKDIGELIGTSFTARDMMKIVDALDEGGMLNYYGKTRFAGTGKRRSGLTLSEGQSYGTVLGATAAAMFPDRVGKVVLDGVVNPTQYWQGQ